jgi:hypothetical protein
MSKHAFFNSIVKCLTYSKNNVKLCQNRVSIFSGGSENTILVDASESLTP